MVRLSLVYIQFLSIWYRSACLVPLFRLIFCRFVACWFCFFCVILVVLVFTWFFFLIAYTQMCTYTPTKNTILRLGKFLAIRTEIRNPINNLTTWINQQTQYIWLFCPSLLSLSHRRAGILSSPTQWTQWILLDIPLLRKRSHEQSKAYTLAT